MIKVVVWLLLSGWVSSLYAEEGDVLTLSRAIETALTANPDLRKTALQRTGEEYDLEVTAERWDPQWQWRSQVERWEQSGDRTQEVGTELHMGYQLPWGTQIESSVGQGVETQFSVQVTQPLLKGQGKKTTLAPLFMAQEQYKISEWQRAQQTIDLLTQVISQYRQLQLLQKQIEIQKRLHEQAQKSVHNIELRIEAGRNPDNDKLQAQLEVMRQAQALSEAERLAEQAKNGFELLLYLKVGARHDSPELSWSRVEDFQEPDVQLSDLSVYQEYALAHHPQLQQLKIQADMNERELWVAKDALKWDLSAVGSVSWAGIGDPVTQPDNLEDVMVSPEERYYAGLRLTVPLGSKKTQKQALVRANLAKEQWEISYAQAQQTIAYNIKNAWQEVQAKARQRELSQESLKLARASLSAVQQKFDTGRTASFELVAMQQQLQQMELEAISVTIAYYNAFTLLKSACGMFEYV